MPVSLTDYDVTTPDGTAVKFRGPSDMSDDQVKLRAQQEAAFKTGKIPTTFTQGAAGSIADDSKNVGTVVGLGGALAGQPEVVAAAPLIGRAVKAGAEYVAGRPVTPPDIGELAGLAAQGAVAGYGPQVAGKLLQGFAGSTVAHQLPNGSWVKGASGSGVLPWAVRTAGEVAGKVAPAITTPAAKVGFAAAVTAAIGQTSAAVAQGVPPSKAAMDASGGNPSIFAAIMSHFMSGGAK